jgi:hypothetical protein
MSIEAMKRALEALERAVSTCFDRRAHEDVMSRPEHFINQAITALRTAIAEAEKQEQCKEHGECFGGKCIYTTTPAQPAKQKPVAWANINKHGDITHTSNKRMPWSKTPLYTTPPAAQRPWVGLTDAEIAEWDYDVRDVVMDIEKLLRDKNT